MNTTIGVLAVFAACIFWALDTLLRYPMLQNGTLAIQIVFFEHVLLGAVMALWLWRYPQQRFSPWPYAGSLLFVGGLGSALGTLAFTQAFLYINPTVVILLQKLQPFIAIAGARLVLGERWHPAFPVLALLAVGGTILIMGQDLETLSHIENWQGYGAPKESLLGYSFALIAVIGWGLATVFGKRLLNQGLDAGQVMAGRFLCALLVLSPVALLYEQQGTVVFNVNNEVFFQIVVMALLAGLLGMGTYYHGLRSLPAHITTLAELFFPVAAIVINWMAFDARITLWQALGAALLTLCAIAAQRLHHTAGQTQARVKQTTHS